MARLPEPAANILAQQLTSIHHIYRFWETGEVLLYKRQDPEPPSFPNRHLELKWLTVHLHSKHDAPKGKVQIYLVKGRVFALYFSPPVLIETLPDTLVVERVQFHADVMEACEMEPEQETLLIDPPAVLPEGLKKLGETYWLEAFRAPLEASERARRLAEMEGGLPEDYRELLAVCEGFRVGPVEVLGLREAYSVKLTDGVYWVLAVCGDKFLVVKEGDTSGRVYFVSHEDAASRVSFSDFAKGLAYLLRQCGASGNRL